MMVAMSINDLLTLRRDRGKIQFSVIMSSLVISASEVLVLLNLSVE